MPAKPTPRLTRDEQNVSVASRLYEARRCAKFLLGANYVDTLAPYRAFIQRVMEVEHLSVLSAALKVGKSLPESEAIPLMCVLAAAVEMIEGQVSGPLEAQ